MSVKNRKLMVILMMTVMVMLIMVTVVVTVMVTVMMKMLLKMTIFDFVVTTCCSPPRPLPIQPVFCSQLLLSEVSCSRASAGDRRDGPGL